MVTGEYLVLCGATSLALPLKFGQELISRRNASNFLHWISRDRDGSKWFEGKYDPEKYVWETSSDRETAEVLGFMLQECQKLNSSLRLRNWQMETKLEFDRQWGWGSSSTLINNLALWAEVDAFDLSERTLGGSGYDIACAQSEQPLLYRREEGKGVYEKVDWYPPFSSSMFFVFTGKKRNSRKATAQLDLSRDYSAQIVRVNQLTSQILQSRDVTEFSSLILEHESLIGRVLGKTPVQKKTFHDFPGGFKSLGAWGGDFLLAVSREGESDVRDYFHSRGLKPIFRFDEIICND